MKATKISIKPQWVEKTFSKLGLCTGDLIWKRI